MALGFYFAPKGMTGDAYDDVIKQLEAAGQGAPRGRQYHVAFDGGEGGLHVFDVWDSKETFDQFGQTLMPILADAGVDVGEPQIVEVHNIIEG